MAEGRSLLVATSRLQTQLSRFPSELLDRTCAESHLGKLVHCIEVETMVIMATAELELTRVEVDDIQRAWPREPAIQKLKIFNKWQEKKQSEATYRYVTIAINSLPSFIGGEGCTNGDFICLTAMNAILVKFPPCLLSQFTQPNCPFSSSCKFMP